MLQNFNPWSFIVSARNLCLWPRNALIRPEEIKREITTRIFALGYLIRSWVARAVQAIHCQELWPFSTTYLPQSLLIAFQSGKQASIDLKPEPAWRLKNYHLSTSLAQVKVRWGHTRWSKCSSCFILSLYNLNEILHVRTPHLIKT